MKSHAALAAGKIEFRHLRGFVAVAEELSFTRAAQRLCVSQSSLSRAVDALEKSVGARLLSRTTRGVTLTVEGEHLKATLDRLLQDLHSALQFHGGIQPLRLGFAWLLPDLWAQEALTLFEAATEGRIELIRHDEALAGVDRGLVDVAVVRGNAPPGLESVLLFYERRVVAVSHLSPLAGQPSIAWPELVHHPLVVNVVSGTTHPDQWPEHSRPTASSVCKNFDEWLETVAAGRGIGVVPGIAVHRVAHPAVRFIPLRGAPLVPVRLAYPRQGSHPLVGAFVRAARSAECPAYAYPP
ncbi:LysR family transcriptional regulator [Kitasatospora nipponensis]|uniref:LysR family transcriptional regulator n=1 Tax=Kitasatospora nipponensis TaxID=258049 RepID=A0ABN1WFR3_9ACTN